MAFGDGSSNLLAFSVVQVKARHAVNASSGRVVDFTVGDYVFLHDFDAPLSRHVELEALVAQEARSQVIKQVAVFKLKGLALAFN